MRLRSLVARLVSVLARAQWLRAAVFPLLRRSPALAMTVSRVLRLARGGGPPTIDISAAPADGTGDMSEPAREVLSALYRAARAGREPT